MVRLNQRIDVELHIIAEIVEAEFVIRTVGYIARIGVLAFDIVHIVLDTADCQAEKFMDLAHPLGVARGKVIIDRDDVDAASGQTVEIRRQRRDEGFTFTRTHLSDTALVQGDTADHLNVEVPHSGHSPRTFADGRKSLGQDLVQDLLFSLTAFFFVVDPLDVAGDHFFELWGLGF